MTILFWYAVSVLISSLMTYTFIRWECPYSEERERERKQDIGATLCYGIMGPVGIIFLIIILIAHWYESKPR